MITESTTRKVIRLASEFYKTQAFQELDDEYGTPTSWICINERKRKQNLVEWIGGFGKTTADYVVCISNIDGYDVITKDIKFAEFLSENGLKVYLNA